MSGDQLFETDPGGDEGHASRDGSRAAASGAAGGRGGAEGGGAPLAVRMRPRTLDEVVGQDHILGPGSVLRTAIEAGRPHSSILYGPPGTGKTTLARIAAAGPAASAAAGPGADAPAAGETGTPRPPSVPGHAFEEESAVNAGRAEIRAVIERARERRRGAGRDTVLFLDEIHRFNKAQQDALLPAVEEGLVTLIGATTENPYFEVNSALISRCQVYELKALGTGGIETLLRRALADPERGIPAPAPAIADDALAMLAARSAGDARTALGALERAAELARAAGAGGGAKEDVDAGADGGGSADGRATGAHAGAGMIDVATVEDALQRAAVNYDRAGDAHYDYISAWIKATRGSDPDASIYYLAAMLEGGEDPRFIARRMVILASEDVGNADPRALLIADAAARAVDRVGLPECALNLAQAAVYLARAPKSNSSYVAINEARAEIRAHGAQPPPDYLRDAHYAGAAKLGRGEGYQYPHDHPAGRTDQPLLPESLQGRRFVQPSDRGEDKQD